MQLKRTFVSLVHISAAQMHSPSGQVYTLLHASQREFMYSNGESRLLRVYLIRLDWSATCSLSNPQRRFN